MKVNEKQIAEMKNLRNSGSTLNDIALIFNVSKQTVYYYVKPGEKERRVTYIVNNFKGKNYDEKRAVYNSRKKYIASWLKRKYNSNEVFRESKKKYCKNRYRILKNNKKQESEAGVRELKKTLEDTPFKPIQSPLSKLFNIIKDKMYIIE
jgi:hypothetical protein